jgi:hypothetical protein
MSVEMVIALKEKKSAQAVIQAVEFYKRRLKASIVRTQRRLQRFEDRYAVDTAQFLEMMTAEDLNGGDIEYVEWAGEAQLLQGLRTELAELEYAHYRLP